VRKIRAGEFKELGRKFPDDEPILLALAGRGLLEAAGVDEGESEGEEGEE
jgi:hypothetical protein